MIAHGVHRAVSVSIYHRGVSGHTKGSFGSREEESIRHYLPGVLRPSREGSLPMTMQPDSALLDRLDEFYIAVEQSPAATAITDANGVIRFVNHRFEEVTGYARSELIGQTPAVIQSGHTERQVYDDLWTTLRAGQVWRGEMLNRRKNGELYWEHEVITPVRNAAGVIVSFVAVKEDITARKHQEQEQRLLAVAFETGQAALITDAEQRIVRVNQRLQRDYRL